MKRFLQCPPVLLLLLCCLLCELHISADAAVRSSRSSYSSYSSYRSVRYSSGGNSGIRYTGSVSGLVRGRFSTFVQAYALSRGVFYARYRYRTHYPNSQPTLCVNLIDPLSGEFNDSLIVPWYYKNMTVLGIFACPLDDRGDKIYCCGEETAEFCCTFWDNPGRIALVVVLIVVVLAALAYSAFRIYRKHFGLRPSASAAYVPDSIVMDKKS